MVKPTERQLKLYDRALDFCTERTCKACPLDWYTVDVGGMCAIGLLITFRNMIKTNAEE